jgi:Arc/MetJ family transcription regulator
MGRTNVVVDDALVERVMTLYGMRTRRDAIDYALRALAGKKTAHERALELEGLGWDGDLEQMRTEQVERI